MPRAEFDQLTEKEKLFIRKEYENKFLSDVTWIRNAVLNAEANVNRKKGKRFQDLFPKKRAKPDKDYNEQAIEAITAIEQKKGKSWVERVYRANGAKLPRKGG